MDGILSDNSLIGMVSNDPLFLSETFVNGILFSTEGIGYGVYLIVLLFDLRFGFFFFLLDRALPRERVFLGNREFLRRRVMTVLITGDGITKSEPLSDSSKRFA